MDTIHFEPEVDRVDWMRRDVLFANIIINGIPLIKMVCDYERDYVYYDSENPSRKNGGYEHQFAEDLVSQITDPDQRMQREYVAVLICSCTVQECDSILVRMEETDDCVLWHDLHSLRFSIKERYHEFRSFRFDKKEFWQAVERLGSHDTES